jgi:TPR repeat protein
MKMLVSITTVFVGILLVNLCSAAYSDAALSCYQSFALSEYKQAYKDCKKAARNGDSESQFKLATLYARGQGVKKDLEDSTKWLQQSAEQGHAGAQHNLGVAYQQGSGLKIDKESAADNYRLSAVSGNVKSQRNLAYMYERGDGIDQDLYKAYQWHLRSAENSLASGQLKVGLMLLKGEGVDENRDEGLVWIKKSAESGEADAQFVLGLLLIENEPAEAVMWYEKAAASDHILAMYNLAVYLSSDSAENQNLERAGQLADYTVKAGYKDSVDLATSIQEELNALVKLSKDETPEISSVELESDQADLTKKSVSISSSQEETTAELSTIEIILPIENAALDEQWLLNVNPRLYTLQLFISSSLSRANEFIKEHGIGDVARQHSTIRNDSVVYIVTYGEFFEVEDANIALAELPKVIKDLIPILKKYEDLQRGYYMPKKTPGY